jgi:serine/threonine-protein kinase
MGTVYRARDQAIGADVAIKCLIPAVAAVPQYRARFLREAIAANRVDHENIIAVSDVGETDDGQLYLVMELLHGNSLAAEVQKGPLGVARSVDIAIQCAGALARAHELGVIHRDVKPGNIYLVATSLRRDFVKILDFGLAHVKGELRLTATGAVFGTPEYMAPEQARGAPVTGLADLYALGCVLFEMLTGTLPFTGSTSELILKHMREPAPVPSSRAPDVPPDLDAVVCRLLEKDPRKRYRDGYHLLEDLRPLAERLRGDVRSPRSSADGGLPRQLLERRPPEGVSFDLTEPNVAEGEGWEKRVELYRALVARAYPQRPPPARLLPAIDELAVGIARVRELERQIIAANEQAAEHEARTRQLRLQIGRAIDELGADESRTLRRIEELHGALAECRRSLAEREAHLSLAIEALRSLDPAVTVETARKLAEAGTVARAWLDLDANIQRVLEEIEARERECDDLRFQIAQLRGRLAAIAAEEEFALGKIRERAAALAREREAQVGDLQVRANGILDHLAGFAEVEEVFRKAGVGPEPGGGTGG